MNKKYFYIAVIFIVFIISLLFLFIQYSKIYYGCTDVGCMSWVTLILDNSISFDEDYKHELEINNKKYILYENDYNIAFVSTYENQTFINLNNYIMKQLDETNQLKSLNINFIELSNEGEILNRYSVKNYELIAEKFYPNGKHCEPFCYKADPIYLILE